MDGLGELTGAPGAAAELPENPPDLSWAFARSPGDPPASREPLLACFCDSGLFLPLYGIFAYVLPLMAALIGQDDQAGGLEFG